METRHLDDSLGSYNVDTSNILIEIFLFLQGFFQMKSYEYFKVISLYFCQVVFVKLGLLLLWHLIYNIRNLINQEWRQENLQTKFLLTVSLRILHNCKYSFIVQFFAFVNALICEATMASTCQ